jgi:hypothetical protein
VHLQEDFCYNDSIMLYNSHPYQTNHFGCVPDGDGLFGLSCFSIKNVDRHAWEDCTGADCLTPKWFYYSQIEVLDGQQVVFTMCIATRVGTRLSQKWDSMIYGLS